MTKKLEVVLSPKLQEYIDFEKKNVVVIDVLRATSTIVYAFHKGFERIHTCQKIDVAKGLKTVDSLIAGERNGEKLPGFDMGNSPSEILKLKSFPKNLVLTSTNGTQIVEYSFKKGAENIICGALINSQSVANFLNESDNDIVLFCAGWRGVENIEDTLMAGSVIDKLFEVELLNDSALMAKAIYQNYKHNLMSILEKATHYQRLIRNGNLSDVELCSKEDIVNLLPILESFQNEVAVFKLLV